MNGPLRKAMAGTLVALVILLVFEVLLHLFLGPPPPATAVFSGLEPRDSYLTVDGDSVTPSFQIHEAAAGERLAPILPFRRTSDGPRVVVLGGSSVHGGSGLSMAQEFPALLQKRLGSEVLNLAAPALDSHDLVRLAEELGPVEIETVVVYTGHNDFGNTYFQERYGDLAGGTAARSRAFLERFQLYAQLRRSLGGLDGRPYAHGQRAGVSYPPLDTTRFWAALRYLESNLRKLAWICDGRGVDLVLVVPTSSLVSAPVEPACREDPCASKSWRQGLALSASDPTRALELLRQARDLDPIPLRAPSLAMERVRQVAWELDLGLVDPSNELPRDTELDLPRRTYFKDVVHFTAAGHAAMADLLASAIRSRVEG